MSVFIGEKGKRVELAERKDATNPNLLLNSRDFSSNWTINNAEVTSDSYNGGKVVSLHANGNGINSVNQDVQTTTSQMVTWSVYAKADNSGDQLHTELFGGSGATNQALTTNWNRYTFTGTFNPTNSTLYFWRMTGNKGNIQIALPKLEIGNTATPWCPALEDYAWESDITNLQNQVDSKTSGTVVTAYDIASKKPTTVTNSYTSEELVDQGALSQFADQINQLSGSRTVDAPDFNTLTDTGVYHITNPDKGKNNPPTTIWGILTVLNGGNSQRIVQILVIDSKDTFVRTYAWSNNANANVWYSWNQIAWKSDITNLQNMINQQSQTIQSLTTRLTNLENKVGGTSA